MHLYIGLVTLTLGWNALNMAGPCIFKDVNVEWCNLALMEVKHYFALCSCNCGNFTNILQAAFCTKEFNAA
jgi:hypothetical protein